MARGAGISGTFRLGDEVVNIKLCQMQRVGQVNDKVLARLIARFAVCIEYQKYLVFFSAGAGVEQNRIMNAQNILVDGLRQQRVEIR